MSMIFEHEPLRYTDRRRWFGNNGFRRRWLALGEQTAAAINAARQGSLEAAAAVAPSFWLPLPKASARALVAAAQRLPSDVTGYRIRREGGVAVVEIPHVRWTFSKRGPRPEVSWQAMWTAPAGNFQTPRAREGACRPETI